MYGGIPEVPRVVSIAPWGVSAGLHEIATQQSSRHRVAFVVPLTDAL